MKSRKDVIISLLNISGISTEWQGGYMPWAPFKEGATERYWQ